MIFLYIAASICAVMCAANVALCFYALRVFRKWRGSVMARFADLDAMIAALPAVLREELSAREQEAENDREERDEKDKKAGVDITEDVMRLWQYSIEDAFKAARRGGGDGE